jgi:hypothetical protein
MKPKNSAVPAPKATTILFPIPIEFVKGLADLLAKHTA